MIADRRKTLPDTSLDVDLILIVLGTTALVMLLASRTTLSHGALLAIIAAALLGMVARVLHALRDQRRTHRKAPLLGRPVGFMMVASIATGMLVATLAHVPDGVLVVYMVITLLAGQALETQRARRARHL